MKEISENSLNSISTVQSLIDFFLSLYDQFDRDIWENPSFHNADHVRSIFLSSNKLIIAALAENDPLSIFTDLQTWNETHPFIDKQEFRTICKIAFGLHDLGNILHVTIDKDRITYLEKYTTKGSEKRVLEIVDYVKKHVNWEENLKERWFPLIAYLIKQTIFDYDTDNNPKSFQLERAKEGLFREFVKLVDQTSGLFRENNQKAEIGLLYELSKEFPDYIYCPEYHFNFTRYKLIELLPEKNKREEVLTIFGKELPVEILGLEKDKVNALKWLIIKGKDLY